MRRSFLCNLEKMEIVNKWTHLKIHNGEKSSKCNQSHHGSCLRGHLKQARKPKICQLRTHSLSQQGNSYLKHSGEKSLVQSLQCIYKDAVTSYSKFSQFGDTFESTQWRQSNEEVVLVQVGEVEMEPTSGRYLHRHLLLLPFSVTGKLKCLIIQHIEITGMFVEGCILL